jgi:hypothetical protein
VQCRLLLIIWLTATYRIPFIVPHELKIDGVVEVNDDLPVCQLRLKQLKGQHSPRRTPGSSSETGKEVYDAAGRNKDGVRFE